MWTRRSASCYLLALTMLAHAISVPVSASSSPIAYRSYAEMARYLLELNATYPDVVHVSVAQETYDLPYPEELECMDDDEAETVAPCKQFVVHLTNHSTLANDPERPEVFISGALHGNERVGPAAAIELIALMAHSASAYAVDDSLKPTLSTQRWVRELVNTRNVLVTPMTNAYGYAHDHREELSIDPNRDYNYMRSGKECMQTMTSRVVNEIWREHVFQLAVTFHGGTRAVSYEWGSPDHYLNGDSTKSEKSPDHMAQFQVAHTLANFAGVFPDGKLYPTGTMNDIVYGVTGGMEDWGYAASWENQFYTTASQPFRPCEPTTFGGYPKDKTVYNNITHRAFNMLVETSHKKEPEAKDLGLQSELYAANVDFFRTQESDEVVGHVPRNVRLALMMIEMVQPMLRWVEAAGSDVAEGQTSLEDFPAASMYTTDSEVDQVTQMGCGLQAWERNEVATCNATQCSVVDPTLSKLQIAWEVLGAITVDSTHVQVSTSATFEEETILVETATQQGTTRRFYEFSSDSPQAEAANVDTMGTSLFVTCLDLGNVTSEKLYVRAVATVDQVITVQTAKVEDSSEESSDDATALSTNATESAASAWGDAGSASASDANVVGDDKSEDSDDTVKVPEADDEEDDNDDDTGSTVSDEQDSEVEVGTESTSVPTPSVTAVGVASTNAPVNTDADEEDEDDDDNKAGEVDEGDEGDEDDQDIDEEEVDTTLDDEMKAPDGDEGTATSNPPVSTPAPSPSSSTQGTTALASNGSGVQDKDAPSSLLQFGYLIMSSGAMVIILTLAYLYRRVFSRGRQPYMNINSLDHPVRVTINGANDDYDVDSDDDDGEGPRIARHSHASRSII
ncbi:hypothetical protein BBJ28_00011877 [Nothophytophthora sp. Chile5]|nr:hypothetical protein BBJ28_00011877 [Nothophytophthora sp. Chile5]